MVLSTFDIITLCSSESAFDSLNPGIHQLPKFPIKPTFSCTTVFGFQRKKCGFDPPVAKQTSCMS